MEGATLRKYASTPESQNFAKLSRLFVDLLRDVLWEALTKRLSPEEIPEKVRQNKQKLKTAGKMREDQYMRICRPGGSEREISNEDFNITLLYMLLRNLPMKEKIQRPTKGWGCDSYPDKNHLTEGDDIERIRLRRYEVFVYAGKASVSKDKFDMIWRDMLGVVKRFDTRLKTSFASAMEVILKDEMPSDFKNQQMHVSYTREIAMEANREAAKSKQLTEKCIEEMENVKRGLAETERKVDDLARDVREKKKGSLLPEDEHEDFHKNRDHLLDLIEKQNIAEPAEKNGSVEAEKGQSKIGAEMPSSAQVPEVYEGEKQDMEDAEEFLQAIRNNDQKVEEMIRNQTIPKQSIMKVAIKQDGYSNHVLLALSEMSKLLCSKISQAVGVYCGFRPEDPHTTVFVVTLENQKCLLQRDKIPEPFIGYEIITRYKYVPNDEERRIVEQYGSKSIRSEDFSHLNSCIATHTERLMREHSNLSIIRPCSVKTRSYLRKEMKVIEDTCIVFYVPVKGIIPVGEKEFPRVIDRIVTDVREGEFIFFGGHSAMDYQSKLRMGCCITGGRTGSLGGFVDLPDGKVGCLTAAHVVLTDAQIFEYTNMREEEKRNLNNDFAKGSKIIEIHQPNQEEGFTPFGRVQAIALDAGNIYSPSVDATIIQITDHERIPEKGNFPDGDFENAGITEEEPLFYCGGDILNDIEPIQKGSLVIKFGCTTGITRGYLQWAGESVRPVNAWGNYCFPVMMGQWEVNRHDFAEPGDSGALVFLCYGGNIQNLHAVGMIIGGSSTGCSCFITPIKAVFERLGLISNRFKAFPRRHLSQQLATSQPPAERINMFEHLTRFEQNVNKSMNEGFTRAELDIKERITTVEQKLNERLMTVEQKMNEHLTTVENNMNERIATSEQTMNENINRCFDRMENLFKDLLGKS